MGLHHKSNGHPNNVIYGIVRVNFEGGQTRIFIQDVEVCSWPGYEPEQAIAKAEQIGAIISAEHEAALRGLRLQFRNVLTRAKEAADGGLLLCADGRR